MIFGGIKKSAREMEEIKQENFIMELLKNNKEDNMEGITKFEDIMTKEGSKEKEDIVFQIEEMRAHLIKLQDLIDKIKI